LFVIIYLLLQTARRTTSKGFTKKRYAKKIIAAPAGAVDEFVFLASSSPHGDEAEDVVTIGGVVEPNKVTRKRDQKKLPRISIIQTRKKQKAPSVVVGIGETAAGAHSPDAAHADWDGADVAATTAPVPKAKRKAPAKPLLAPAGGAAPGAAPARKRRRGGAVAAAASASMPALPAAAPEPVAPPTAPPIARKAAAKAGSKPSEPAGETDAPTPRKAARKAAAAPAGAFDDWILELPTSSLMDVSPAADLTTLACQFRDLQEHCRALNNFVRRMDVRARTTVKLLELAATTMKAPV
jgi:hypothetical protein